MWAAYNGHLQAIQFLTGLLKINPFYEAVRAALLHVYLLSHLYIVEGQDCERVGREKEPP